MQYNLCFINNACLMTELSALEKVCEKHNVNFLSVPSGFLDYASHTNLSSLIDYPLGVSSISMREQEVIFSIEKGVKRVEITVNPCLLASRNIDKIVEDFNILNKICKDKSVECVPIIEYRFSNERMTIELANSLSKNGCSRIVLGTGTIIDNAIDLYVLSKKILKSTPLKLEVAYNGISKDTENTLSKLGIDAVRVYKVTGFAENIKF